MLAYLFWHRPVERGDTAAYERAQERLHSSLAARPPEGFRGSACYRAPELRWLAGDGVGYEDWYLVEDWATLGVLRQAAVSGGHRTAHDEAARQSGSGAGGVYRLDEGVAGLEALAEVLWVTPTRHAAAREPAALLLGDGLRGRSAGLWRRELVLGPAPEYCLLIGAGPGEDVSAPGVGAERLPAGWSVEREAREAVWAQLRA